MAIILGRKPGGSGGGGGAPSGPAGGDLAGTYPNPTLDPTAAVTSIAKDGSAQLTGDVTLSEGAGISLTQAGQDIEIAATGGASAFAMLHDETLGAAGAGFDVQNIDQTYKHLKLVIVARSARAGQTFDVVSLRFNNDSSAIYDSMIVAASGNGTSNNATLAFYAGFVPGADGLANQAGIIEILIPNYAATVFHKTYFGTNFVEFLADDARPCTTGGSWASTAAISRIAVLSANAANLITGSRLTIYGLD